MTTTTAHGHTPTADDPVPVDHFTERKTLADSDLRKYFEAAVKYEASDLLLRGGQVPKLRLRGSLQSLKADALDPVEFEKSIEASISEAQWKYYAEHGSIDLGVDFQISGGTHRFRINIFRTRGRSSIAARRVSNKILNFEQLHLPKVMSQIAMLEQGLVLLAGITGSGKSTTIASMLQHINEQRNCHIVTIEDPIEYLFTDGKALINQREVGIDVPTFAVALRALVRENPDVVLIGEMRDKVTFEAALQAAETGHLVFGTIHASSASQAFGRIYDLFPAEEREAIRNMLAYQMQAFVYQKLLPTIRDDIQRVPAVEILLQSPPTRKFILEGREHELGEVIKGQRQSGMQTFTDSLVDLVEKEYIHPKTAQAAALSPEEVKMRLRGITTD
ncbi:MAG: PilT/PilU family type 4a pilus ATPase [Phycisphaeraceae bacterium]|nr:PilT/PilU family type 4a pilus ATPase [Phycisphaeraceae bacterium]